MDASACAKNGDGRRRERRELQCRVVVVSTVYSIPKWVQFKNDCVNDPSEMITVPIWTPYTVQRTQFVQHTKLYVELLYVPSPRRRFQVVSSLPGKGWRQNVDRPEIENTKK